jgi:hypothetical protein
MTIRKERLTVTVDRDLIEAAEEAVREGRADSVSGWVNRALAERATKEARLEALKTAIAAYEKQFGKLTDQEMLEQERADRESAVVVRGGKAKRARPPARGKP